MQHLEEVLDSLSGSRDTFREILTDAPAILRRICRYAEYQAKRKKTPAWAIISDLTGHGSGVSNAIYHVYRERAE